MKRWLNGLFARGLQPGDKNLFRFERSTKAVITQEFKMHARALRLRVGAPNPTIEEFREVLGFLHQMQGHSADLDYRDLLKAFSDGLRRVVNPFRHLTILQGYRDAGQLREIRVWLELWIDALTNLSGKAMNVLEWHATYDKALYRGLAALIRMRLGLSKPASEGWTEAATICCKWLNQNSKRKNLRDYRRLEASYHFFEARASRSLGQHTLGRQRPGTRELEEAAGHFENGVKSMEQSADIQTDLEGFSAVQELDQLAYLEMVSRYRLALLRSDIPAARGFLDQLAELAPKARFERGYFGDSDEAQLELKIEGDFLDVFEALLQRDLPNSRVAADKLLANLPGETPETPRHLSLRLRALSTQLLAGDPNARNHIAVIHPFEIGFDPANRYLHWLSKTNALSVESALDQVLGVFPLDASPPESGAEEASGLEALDWLPPFYLDWLDESSDSSQGIGKIHFLQWQYVANVAEYLCRLHLMKRARGDDDVGSISPMPSDFRLLGLPDLREILVLVGRALDWTGTDLASLIGWIDRFVTSRDQLSEHSLLVRDFIRCVAETSRFLYPHVVRVKEQTRVETGEVNIRLERVWRLPRRELLLVCHSAKGLLDGGHYFLKANFKEKTQAYFSERQEIVNIYPSTTFSPPTDRHRCCVLVEGNHDEYVFRRLFDRFLPYWQAQVELREGGGDALPSSRAYEDAVRDGYRVLVVADADKMGKWDHLSPIWLTPDFEGVDLDALSEAMYRLWGDSIGNVTPELIRGIMGRHDLTGGTVNRLRAYFGTRTDSVLPEENDMKKALRQQLSDIWLRTGRLPPQISTVLTTVSKTAFGLASP